MTIEEILKEDRERREAEAAPYDPVSGRGCSGARFPLNIGGVPPISTGLSDCQPLPSLMLLPEEMRYLETVQSLLKTESLTRTADIMGMTVGELADRLIRERCLCDFPYWCAVAVKIKPKGGGRDVPFILNRPQRLLVDKFESMRRAGKPIRLVLLKARQWGGSTCTQLYMAWLQLVHACGLNSLIIAHQSMGSEEIKEMFERMMESYPDVWLDTPKGEKKIRAAGRSGAAMKIPARNCKVKIGTAERPDSCRGGDYSLVHCSEVGIWKKTLGKTPEQIVRSACSGVLLQPMTMIVYESTANGTGNFFHREYEAARRGQSQFEPLFVSWYEIEQYSAQLDDDGRRDLAARLLAGREAEGAASDREQPGCYLWWLWVKGATLEAIAWYVSERSKYSDHGLMASEYPSDDVEAFVHSGARVFDKYRVEALRPACGLQPERGEIDAPGAAGATSRAVGDGERRAMLREAAFTPLSSGGWKVWRRPETSASARIRDRYVAVVDVGGRSAKADWSVVTVFDREPMLSGAGPEVVAQWRGHTDFDILAWKAALAAAWYDEALLVIESNTLETRDPDRDIDGDQSGFLLNRLRDVYPNLYARPRGEQEVSRGAPTRYGFHTNTATKPMIIATLVKVIREGLYTERDEACLDEYLAYERRQNGSYGAIAGCHDDLLMTRAIGLHICFHEMEPPVRTQARQNLYTLRDGGRGGFAMW